MHNKEFGGSINKDSEVCQLSDFIVRSIGHCLHVNLIQNNGQQVQKQVGVLKSSVCKEAVIYKLLVPSINGQSGRWVYSTLSSKANGILWFYETKSVIAADRRFLREFWINPPRSSIYTWCKQFIQNDFL